MIYMGSPFRVVGKVLDCTIVVSSNSIHAITLTFGKFMNPIILKCYRLNSISNILLQVFSIKYPTKVDMPLNKETETV